MTYKEARGAVPTRGRGHEYACGIDSDWPGSGGGQYARDTFKYAPCRAGIGAEVKVIGEV